MEDVLFVDGQNRVVGSGPRRLLGTKKYAFRCCFALILKNPDLFLVQKRAKTKTVMPGFYSPLHGGVMVSSDKDKEACIKRELGEELNWEPTDMVYLGDFYMKNEGWNWWNSLFFCTYQGTMRINSVEIEGIEWKSKEMIVAEAARGQLYIPDTFPAFSLLAKTDQIWNESRRQK